jgi:Tol biopolymer transport system component
VLLGSLAVYVGLSRDSGAGTHTGSESARNAAFGGATRNGPLTIFTMDVSDRVDGSPTIRTVKPLGGGDPKIIWSCPEGIVCNQAVSFDWAPDGRRLALSLDQIGGTSSYTVGLHIVDVTTGADRQVPSGAPPGPTNAKTFPAYGRKIMRRVGCWPAAELDWSPDGTKLAYGCGGSPRALPWNFIGILDLEGSGFTAIPTRHRPRWPSWSPDGTRIAYSTGIRPSHNPSLYVVSLDGKSPRKRLAEHAAAPAWSPDGKTIAYWTRCGIRLVTPAGRDVTPRKPRAAGCDAIGLPGGPPVWSPDGTKIAVEVTHRFPQSADGTWVMNADGSNLRRVSLDSWPTWYGGLPGRPSWQPVP